jgi:hypothetical protein
MTELTPEKRNEINQRLLELSDLTWDGLNNTNLVGAVVKTLKHNTTSRSMVARDDNTTQIEFAKLVWNNGNKDVRKLFLIEPNDWFMTLARDPEMVPILSAALDKFQETVRSSNPGAKAAYEEIAKKVAEWRPHVLAAEKNPFYEPQPTKGQIRAVKKFDDMAGNDPPEPHKPNESAVTYPFLLGKIIMAMKVDMSKSINEIKSIVDDVLKFCSLHGQKSVTTFTSKIASTTELKGPKSNIDLKSHLTALVEHSDFVVATGASDDNKYVENHKITLKRIIRLVHICTKYKTVWGLMTVHDGFVEKIKKLHSLEEEVNSPDMNSLAMIWYLAIGRGNICAIMVDHWERSASNELANLLGRDSQSAISAPIHVFPLDKAVTNDF